MVGQQLQKGNRCKCEVVVNVERIVILIAEVEGAFERIFSHVVD
jgi:hypothetical protein